MEKDAAVGSNEGLSSPPLPSPPLTAPPAVGLLRHDAVEVVLDRDMIALYTNGYYGRGTISRRVPNRGAYEVVSTAAKKLKTEDGEPSETNATVDTLARIADKFEQLCAAAPLPEAYAAAACAASKGQVPLAFEAARQTAHYISCPPPRIRPRTIFTTRKQVQAHANAHTNGGNTAAQQGDTSAVANSSTSGAVACEDGKAGQKRKRCKARTPTDTSISNNSHVTGSSDDVVAMALSESSIIEAEAVMYLLLRAPHALAVFIPQDSLPVYADFLNSESNEHLHPDTIWRIFCARIPNFPARFRVYAELRDRGWVVRDGQPFGADFTLYARGPGRDHSPHCIVIMPLRIQLHAQGNLASSTQSSVSVEGASAAPSEGGLLPSRPIVGDWLEAHAVSRVIGTVKKHMVMAYCTLEIDSSSGSGAHQAVIADLLQHPSSVDAISVKLTTINRWHIAHEMMKKTNRTMKKIALIQASSDTFDTTSMTKSQMKQQLSKLAATAKPAIPTGAAVVTIDTWVLSPERGVSVGEPSTCTKETRAPDQSSSRQWYLPSKLWTKPALHC